MRLHRHTAALLTLVLAAAACTPKSENAAAAPAAAAETAPPTAEWRARLDEDAAILRAQLDEDRPNIADGAQAAARIGRLAAEIAGASDDEALAEAAETFEHDAVSLSALYPRQYEIGHLHELIGDFLDTADAFKSAWLAAPDPEGAPEPPAS